MRNLLLLTFTRTKFHASSDALRNVTSLVEFRDVYTYTRVYVYVRGNEHATDPRSTNVRPKEIPRMSSIFFYLKDKRKETGGVRTRESVLLTNMFFPNAVEHLVGVLPLQ